MDTTGFSARIEMMAEAIGSQRALARMAEVSEGAVRNWLRGHEPFERVLRQLVETTGVSEEWLRTGAGDDAAEMAALRSRVDSASRLEEDGFMSHPIPPSLPEKYLLVAAEKLPSEDITRLIGEVLTDKSARAKEIAQRLTEVLSRKLAAEHRGQTRYD